MQKDGFSLSLLFKHTRISPHTSLPRRFALYLMLSWVFALCAQVSLPLPFGIVPMVLHPVPLYISALLLGNHAVYAYGLYLIQGILGAPFFALGLGGLARFMGPTGGYLIGFLVGMMWLTKTYDKTDSSSTLFTKLVAATALHFMYGLLQLSLFIPWEQLLLVGLYPFILGALVKILFITMILRRFYVTHDLSEF